MRKKELLSINRDCFEKVKEGDINLDVEIELINEEISLLNGEIESRVTCWRRCLFFDMLILIIVGILLVKLALFCISVIVNGKT